MLSLAMLNNEVIDNEFTTGENCFYRNTFTKNTLDGIEFDEWRDGENIKLVYGITFDRFDFTNNNTQFKQIFDLGELPCTFDYHQNALKHPHRHLLLLLQIQVDIQLEFIWKI